MERFFSAIHVTLFPNLGLSRLIEKEVPIEVVSKLLGHSTLAVTMRYAHVQDKKLVEAVETLTHARGYLDEKDIRQPGVPFEDRRPKLQ